MNLDFLEIKNSKNLLAFSAGIDSTALFFLLLNSNIPFDIAIVDYNIREQSKEEVAYAQELAKKFNKKIYIKSISLKNLSNFEKQARDVRYTFFEDIIRDNSYEFLITAHQLNDKFEWFLMQLSRGAGLIELLGMSKFEDKEFYKIYRPLLNISKDELISYLHSENIKYFVDESNIDEKYRRNYFRNSFSNSFLKEFKDGVKNSFEFLHNDLKSLNIDFNPIKKIYELEIFKNQNDNNLNLRVIDKSLKKRGVLISSSQRDEIIKQKELTVAHKINIAITENYIFIAPKIKTDMSKDFKERCRVKKLPKNIREYIFIKNIDLNDLIF
ncbi:tRNA lysidine(34) synthetase TilS [Arcobacter sp. AHV-9/2010]|uniref:tRNA lysidine(34) synthetase TilS n=1 Tax=Arcobacter sp. AHV-9/2010 TaxID=2021861 RepID=UPI00100B2BA6|nr:tRNA lysidine(34) synthetase TilS [Arcobacter sp. CECT 9299]RXJ97007.1 tRNA lysidine(34) synthetase TilS [Arcobacter sp. CECT 9299]